MEAKYPEITLGESICVKLKDHYYKDVSWPECYRDVAHKFTLVKQAARKFYIGKTEIEILQALQRYSIDDLVELLAA